MISLSEATTAVRSTRNVVLRALYQDAAFALSFRLREPVAERPRALLLLLHGVGGSETNLAELAAHIPEDVLVVLPRAPIELSAQQFAWFRVSFGHNGPQIVAHEADTARQQLNTFIQQLQQAYAIPATRTVVAGFSQGGIMSASAALTKPEALAGFAILAGRILPELEPVLAERNRLAHLHAFIGHGTRDSKLPISWAQRAVAVLDQLRIPHTTRLYPVEHELSVGMVEDLLSWLHTVLTERN